MFNIKEVRQKYEPTREESLNTVLLQEMGKYNKLIKTIKSSLTELKDALAGLVVFSFESESILNQMGIGKVPVEWMKHSYPSLKALGSYLKDLIERCDF